MKKFFSYTLLIVVALSACSKGDNSAGVNTNLTVQSLSGTYSLKALTWQSSGITVNVYDQLDDCEKDDLIKLNADKTANFIDAGIMCAPPGDDTGTWDLKGDSLYTSGSDLTSKIQSFDGKTLVLTGSPPNEPGVKATTTLQKQP